MRLVKLQLQNLRCFVDDTIEFPTNITLIEGANGSGKTTIVEALYYLCYLRSFRTPNTKDLIRFKSDNFFIKAELSEGLACEQLQVGFSASKRLVKFNDKPISSFKELIQSYRVVVLTENDLDLIKGGPDERRNFIDQYIYLQDPSWHQVMRHLRQIVQQRNALLKNNFDPESFIIWTEQLNHKSELIRTRRQQALAEVQVELGKILQESFGVDLSVEFHYQPKLWQPELQARELIMGYSLCGAQLDDYQIQLNSHSSRKFASRGQQKLVSVLMKVVQVLTLRQSFSGAILFILDDFLTDLDDQRADLLLKLLAKSPAQLIFTAPNMSNHHRDQLLGLGASQIKL